MCDIGGGGGGPWSWRLAMTAVVLLVLALATLWFLDQVDVIGGAWIGPAVRTLAAA